MTDNAPPITPLSTPDAPLPAGTQVGHVHLKVSDLEESVRFYRDILGFTVNQYYGDQAAFLGAGGYHHHIGLNTWMSRGGSTPPPGATGLFHAAIRVPTRLALARVTRRILDAGWPLQGASDHGVSEAIYLADPDGNGLEIYRDRDPDAWPRDAEGVLAMVTEPLDMGALLAELE